MDHPEFQSTKKALDEELDQYGDTPGGIALGLSLYSDFRRHGLLTPKLVDMLLWKWTLPSYRDRYVCESADVGDYGFKVGGADA